MEVGIGEGDQPRGSVVGEVQEDVIFSSGLKDSSCPDILDACFIASQNILKDGRSYMLASVVDLDPLVDILADVFMGGLVEDFSLEGVPDVVSNIIIGKGDDVVRVKFILEEDLISVVDIRLMPIVGVRVGASNQHSPIGARGQPKKGDY